ncbi:PREDICTED: kallikrein-14-like, partial [Tauraco erythrolophus]|uniref:kallikrein-14-like n=1 Tax=Tauraco erythrolophus TaxID=121530 RepID=UPI000523A7C1
MARDGHGAFDFTSIFILTAGLLLSAQPLARAQATGNEGDELPDEDESRIIGGRPCSISQRPFQVALIKRGQILCGGSLVAAQWVLTAAHCRQPIRDLKVLIGTASLRGGTGEVRTISKVQVHPAYNPRKNDNDFMLLRLNRPVQFSSDIKKIRLATRCPTDGMKCSVSGWGTTRSPGGNQLARVDLGGRGGKATDWARGEGSGDLISWEKSKGCPDVTFPLPNEQLLMENTLQLGFPFKVLFHVDVPTSDGVTSIGHVSQNPTESVTRSTQASALPQNLQCAAIETFGREKCARAYGNAVTANMFCAGVPQGGVDSCQ